MNERSEMCAERLQKKSLRQNEKNCSDRPKYPSFSRKREVYLSDGKYRCGSRNCPGTCMDKRRRRYASDRSQCNAGKRRTYAYGQLGDVMKESARTGISYIRSVSKKYAISPDFFEKHDIHVHIPEGAVPKDGPSAGITMAVAMLSAITEKKVRADLAMTGEVTLRGRVLPIGGLKEKKLLAAKSAGIKTVLVPKANQADVEELSAEITKGMEILFVESMDEVLKAAMGRKRKMKGSSLW